VPDAIVILAILAWKHGDWSRAAGLLGAAQAMRERTGAISSPLIAAECRGGRSCKEEAQSTSKTQKRPE
jgi:hypothetical protein